MDTRPDLARKGLVTLLQLGVSAVAAVALAAYGIQQLQPSRPAPSQLPSTAGARGPAESSVLVAVNTLPSPSGLPERPEPPAPRQVRAPGPGSEPDGLPGGLQTPIPVVIAPPPAPVIPPKRPAAVTAPTTLSPSRPLSAGPELNPEPTPIGELPTAVTAPKDLASSLTGPRLVGLDPPQAEAPNPGFEAYARWLEMIQEERSRLRSRGDASSLRNFAARQVIPGPAIVTSAGDRERAAGALPTGVQRTREALQSFEWRISRAKPTVPPDFLDLDRFYTEAIEAETGRTAALIDAVVRGDDAQVQSLRRAGVSEVDRSLSIANAELERLARKHGLRQAPTLRTGQSASLLGDLTGPGGVR